jgi:hypothetical protein
MNLPVNFREIKNILSKEFAARGYPHEAELILTIPLLEDDRKRIINLINELWPCSK